ncbi:MAG: toxin-antitoxin system, antitoxin component [Candidatus Delongbacteria bacterium]|nr:toxin-antitoxin system, antitoxin component [Candidatus Delongbacteria bacterium]
MPQISLYVDEETLTKVEKAAKGEKMSISKWVGTNIQRSLENKYPKGYFDLFGSINDDTMAGKYKGDAGRVIL